MEKFKIYLESVLIPIIVGGIVGLIISDSIDYDTLTKPFFRHQVFYSRSCGPYFIF